MSEIVKRWLIEIRDGTIYFEDDNLVPLTILAAEKFIEFLNRQKHSQRFFSIEPIYKQRSIQENRYLFGVPIKILREETEQFGGWEPLEVYRWLEWFFLNNYPDDGEPHRWVSIKELSTKDFEELMEAIRRWGASEMGIDIPEPNEARVVGEEILF